MQGDRVELAPLRDEDSDTLFRWINDRELVVQSAPFRPVEMAEHRAWFDDVRSRDHVAIFGIRLREGDRLIGACQLVDIDERGRSAELRIRIGERDAQERGYGGEAVRLLLRHAFDELDLQRVHLHVFATNKRAIRLYERAGFTRQAVHHNAAEIEGEPVDVVLMELLRHERQSGAVPPPAASP